MSTSFVNKHVRVFWHSLCANQVTHLQRDGAQWIALRQNEREADTKAADHDSAESASPFDSESESTSSVSASAPSSVSVSAAAAAAGPVPVSLSLPVPVYWFGSLFSGAHLYIRPCYINLYQLIEQHWTGNKAVILSGSPGREQPRTTTRE